VLSGYGQALEADSDGFVATRLLMLGTAFSEIKCGSASFWVANSRVPLCCARLSNLEVNTKLVLELSQQPPKHI